MQPNEKAMSLAALQRGLRQLRDREAKISFLIEQGLTDDEAQDLLADYERSVFIASPRTNQGRFTDSDFFKQLKQRYQGGQG